MWQLAFQGVAKVTECCGRFNALLTIRYSEAKVLHTLGGSLGCGRMGPGLPDSGKYLERVPSGESGTQYETGNRRRLKLEISERSRALSTSAIAGRSNFGIVSHSRHRTHRRAEGICDALDCLNANRQASAICRWRESRIFSVTGPLVKVCGQQPNGRLAHQMLPVRGRLDSTDEPAYTTEFLDGP